MYFLRENISLTVDALEYLSAISIAAIFSSEIVFLELSIIVFVWKAMGGRILYVSATCEVYHSLLVTNSHAEIRPTVHFFACRHKLFAIVTRYI